MAKSKRTKTNSLKSGRPPAIGGGTTKSSSANKDHAINARKKSSRATRTLINKHHQLQKLRAAAASSGNDALVTEIDEQIRDLGGLEAYQAASLTGQDKERGGDSSEKLVEWLKKHGLVGGGGSNFRHFPTGRGLRVLEIGALSSKNAISNLIGKGGIEHVKRIDLHSQEPNLIEEIDFMDLNVPENKADKFDIVSLSLVLNYVPDIAQRGEMLRRTTLFLRRNDNRADCDWHDGRENLPQIFVVLPLPCLNNSRYMTHDHFVEIMASLRYTLIEHHDSQKLSYMLFIWDGSESEQQDLSSSSFARQQQQHKNVREFRKIEINPGRSRNNFAIGLGPEPA